MNSFEKEWVDRETRTFALCLSRKITKRTIWKEKENLIKDFLSNFIFLYLREI